MNRAFDTSPSFVSEDPISTGIGVFFEALPTELSLGLVKPDIVPQWQEDEFPLATTVGRVAGSVVGFAGSMAIIGGVGKTALAALPFGRTLLNVARAAEVGKKATRASITTVSAFRTGLTFGAHDLAQEFIQQYKEQDPDSVELAKKALSGFVAGGIFGTGEKAFALKNIPTQMLAGASSMTLANTLVRMAEGEETTKESVAFDMTVGALMAGFQARGWKERKATLLKKQSDELLTTLGEMADPNSSLSNTLQKHQIDYKAMPKNVQVFADYVKGNLEKKTKPLLDQLDMFPEYARMSDTQKQAITGAMIVLDVNPKNKKMVDVFLENMKRVTGKEKKLGEWEKLTPEQADLFINDLYGYITSSLDIKPVGAIGAKLLRDPLTTVEKLGLTDYMDDSMRASIKLDFVRNDMMRSLDANLTRYYESFGITAKESAKAFIKNINTAADDELYKALRLTNKQYYGVYRKNIPKEQAEVIDNLRKVIRTFWTRMNETLVALGEKPIGKIDGYLPIIEKLATGATKEKSVGGLEAFKALSFPGETFNPTRLERTAPEAGRELVTNPRKLLQTMINYDLKTFYLDEPFKVARARLGFLKDMGLLDEDHIRYLADLANAMAGRPTRAAIRQNISTTAVADVTQATKIMQAVASKFGRNAPDNIFNTFSSIFNRAASDAFIAGRPGLAIRNSMQMFLVHSFADTKNIAKAMVSDTPEALTKMLDKSIIYKYSKSGAVEVDVAASTMGQVRKTAYELFTKSHGKSVDFVSKAAYFQTMDYILMPKYSELGWADKAGISMRTAERKAGNKDWMHVLSQDEYTKVAKEVDYLIQKTQFLYHLTGMPWLYTTPAGKVGAKLLSYPINFTTQYLDESLHRMIKGSPSWDKTGTVKIPFHNRYGLFRQTAAAALFIAGMERLGIDFSDITSVSYQVQGKPVQKDAGPVARAFSHVNFGPFDLRPSPGVQALLSFKDLLFGADPYIQAQAERNLKNLWVVGTGVVAPGGLGVKDLLRAAEEDDFTRVFLRKTRTRKQSTPKQINAFATPRAFQPIQPIQPFMGGR